MNTTDLSSIEINNLTKYYGSTRGVENLNLKVKQGIILGYLGPNGAGKTTTIRCLLGILKRDSGSLNVLGEEINNWRNHSELKERIGYLPGEFELYKHLSVKDTLDYFASLRKRPSHLRTKLVELLELDESRATHQLSKGNKQKVGIIIALMHNPDLLILDEPSSGLDPLMQQKLYKVLRDFKAKGKTIFFSSHNLAETQKLCDEVAIIKEGKLVYHGLQDELKEKVEQKIILTFKTSLTEKQLEQLPYVSKSEPVTNTGKNGHQYHLWISSDVRYGTLFQAMENLPLLKVNIPEISLEDHFLRYYSEEEDISR